MTAAPSRPPPARTARDRYRRLVPWIVFSDGLSVVCAFGLAYVLAFQVGKVDARFALVLALLPVLVAVVFGLFQLYRIYRITPVEEFRRLLLGVSVVVAAGAFVPSSPAVELIRPWVATSWALSVAFVLVSRRMWHLVIGRRRTRGELTFRAVVIGTNEEARRIARGLRTPGFEPVGFVASGSVHPQQVDGLPVVGTMDDLAGAIAGGGADCVVVASSAISTESLRRAARISQDAGAELRISANLPEVLAARISIQPLAGVMVVTMRPAELFGWQAALKRAVDIGGSAAGLLLLGPLLLVVAGLVKASSPGPIFYRQVRAGRRGRPFTMVKFRTMVLGADAMRDALVDHNQARAPLFKIREDPRLHRFGRWMRRWSLDELPQLWNVLRGQMSLVGPRPALPEEVERYEDWHRDRLEVPPGMTGLWQVSGRAELAFDDYVRLDLFYIENWSLAYDLFILAKTIPAVIRGDGSY